MFLSNLMPVRQLYDLFHRQLAVIAAVAEEWRAQKNGRSPHSFECELLAKAVLGIYESARHARAVAVHDGQVEMHEGLPETLLEALRAVKAVCYAAERKGVGVTRAFELGEALRRVEKSGLD